MLYARAVPVCIGVLLVVSASSLAMALDCGDADGDGYVSMLDVQYMMNYIFAGGPSPPDFDEADYDGHQLLTQADASLLASSETTCDIITPLCPPDDPPLFPEADSAYRILYTDRFPANETSGVCYLTLSMPHEVFGMALPIRILVDGQTPVVDSIRFPTPESEFSSYFSRYSVRPDEGYILLGAQCRWWFAAASGDRFTAIYLSVPAYPIERPIKAEWVILSPAQAPEADSSIYPLATGFCHGFIEAPVLVKHCCIVPGDANDDGIANVSDVVFLIGWIFGEGSAPTCMDQADADGNGIVNISDAVYLVSYIFGGGPAPVCGLVGV